VSRTEKLKTIAEIAFYVALAALAFWSCNGDGNQTYRSICDSLQAEPIERCMTDATVRVSLFEPAAARKADEMLKWLRSYPDNLLAVNLNDQLEAEATRVPSLRELPNVGFNALSAGAEPDSSPDLLNRVFVVRSAVSASSGDEFYPEPTAFLAAPTAASRVDGNILISADFLSDQQVDLLELCWIIELCVGDVYLRVASDMLGLELSILGVDLEPVTREQIFAWEISRYRRWLAQLDEEASHD
jgi:hypothetical protein